MKTPMRTEWEADRERPGYPKPLTVFDKSVYNEARRIHINAKRSLKKDGILVYYTLPDLQIKWTHPETPSHYRWEESNIFQFLACYDHLVPFSYVAEDIEWIWRKTQ